MSPAPGHGLPGGVDRRTFLMGLLASAGAVGLGACRGGRRPATPRTVTLPPDTTVPVPPVAEIPPRPRPTVRLPTEDAGLPSPLEYLPTAYVHMTLIYDTLLWPAPDGAPTPWLATDWQRSPDGLTYTFRLRDGVRWHDGRPLTADDVAFSFEYWLAQNRAGQIQPWVIFKPHHVAGARAMGPGTVQVRLERPAVSFPQSVAARFPIVPRHIWSSVELFEGVEQSELVGSGPYRLERYEGGTYLFSANDDFFLGAPFVQRIEMSQVADELNALQAGAIDAGGFAASPTSGRVLARFTGDPAFGVIKGDPGFLTALHWNPARGGAVADVRFRRACALAIDRGDMVQRLLAGVGDPGNPGLLAPGHPFKADVEQYRYDPAAADRLLDEAGYARPRRGETRIGPDGRPLTVTLKSPPELASPAQLVVEDLFAVGVDVQIEPVTDVFFGLGDYEMALLFWGGAGRDTDPDFLRNVFSSRVAKDIFFAARGYANPEFDDLADRQLSVGDEKERERLVHRMQEIVASDLPLLPLYYPTPFAIYRRAVFDPAWVQGGDNPIDKRTLVTGVGGAGTEIRPTT